jgi:hypothetical protein
MFRQSRNAARRSLAVALVVAAALAAARPVRAQSVSRTVSGPVLTVSIISPANGGGTPGQTLQAGVFAVTNKLDITQTVNSVTIAFSNPSMFSSATLAPPAPGPGPSHVPSFVFPLPQPGPVTVSPPSSSTTFTFNSPFFMGPGGEPFFALTVKLSPLSRNETSGVAYAEVIEGSSARGASAPLWLAFAIIGLATAALSEGTRRRAWLIAGLPLLFVIGAPGCGGDSNSPSSTQTVTAVAAQANVTGNALIVPMPAVVTGLPLKIGTIFGQ